MLLVTPLENISRMHNYFTNITHYYNHSFGYMAAVGKKV